MSLMVVGCRSHKGDITISKSETVVIPPTKKLELSKQKSKIIKEAEEWIGTPYLYGGNSKGIGTDCSGLVMTVINNVTGIKLPRNSAKQAEYCTHITLNDLSSCDLVFFATGKSSKKITHVGLMIDTKRFIHASSSKGVVVSSLSQRYYIQRLVKCGRIPGLI